MKKTKAQKSQAKEALKSLRANLALMVPLEVSLNWAIRGMNPDPNKVMSL